MNLIEVSNYVNALNNCNLKTYGDTWLLAEGVGIRSRA